MAVAFVAAIDGTNSASSTTAVVDFTGRSAGQFALVLIGRTNTGDPSSTPSGWSRLDYHESTYSNRLYWKTLGSGDIGSVTWTWASASLVFANAVVYSGVDTATPAYSKGTFGTSSAQTIDFGSRTSTEAWLVACSNSYNYSSTTHDISSWSSPSWTERKDRAGTSSSEQIQLFADTNGGWTSGTFAPSTSTSYISATASHRGGYIVELKAAVSVPTVTVVSPSSGTVAGGTTVTLTGTNFTGATQVKFGIANAPSYTVDSATQITVTSPPGIG